MSDGELIKLSDYCAGEVDDGERVPCAKCGGLVHAYNTRCPHCGIHFDGVACDFCDGSAKPAVTGPRRRARWIAVVLLIAIALFIAAATVGVFC